ncbi:MAG TPA: PRC-barrel domain-containing protein [Candidatus Limnocylindria bacterium]|nr:PRC-barrel domain-containing protein [Candidatus Limnocylindria bacterium]
MAYDTTQRTGGSAGTMTAPSSATWNLVRAGDLQGRSIIGLNDESIGTVGDVFLDYDEHTIRYATVDVGGFLGMGAKTVLVPFEKLQWSSEDLYLPVEKSVLENAPEFDPTADYDRTYEEQVSGAWGIGPYWTTPEYGVRHSHWREGYDRPMAGYRHQDRSL